MRALFLDRDGVINVRKIGGYITDYKDFVFIDGVLEALSMFKNWFKYIFIVTNQQGIGKGLMSEENFDKLNTLMLKEIDKHSGYITKVYHCSSLKQDNDPNRKPSIGMALQAKMDYPMIDFESSVMVGDSMSDMLFGKNASMHTVFIDNHTEKDIDNTIIENTYNSLYDFAIDFKKHN